MTGWAVQVRRYPSSLEMKEVDFYTYNRFRDPGLASSIPIKREHRSSHAAPEELRGSTGNSYKKCGQLPVELNSTAASRKLEHAVQNESKHGLDLDTAWRTAFRKLKRTRTALSF